MAWGAVMEKYKFDAFVSYSHLDNLCRPNASGWVTAFCDAMEMRLSSRLGRPASIWHDRTLSGQRRIDDTIQSAIDNSAVLLVLYSAGYESSDYCAKEREWFAKQAASVGDQSRVLTVRLVNISHEKWPKELRGCTGFDFFTKAPNDPTGFPVDPSDGSFDEKLKGVVAGLGDVLAAINGAPQTVLPEPPNPPPNGASVSQEARKFAILTEPPNPPQIGAPVSQEDREFAILKGNFKTDFQKCFDQIKLLSGRKDLHDQLHELQFKFYIPVSDILPDASTAIDGQLLDIVRDHYFTLSEIMDSLRAIAARKNLPPKELAWLEEVAKARTTFDEGIRRVDLVSLRAAVNAIGRVLAVWPSRINAKLTENARDLAPGALAIKLQQLCGKSAPFKQQLGSKASQLADLEQRISDLAAIHDDWQTFDDELRLLETTLTQSLQDIEDIWPGLKSKAETLYAQNSENWAQRLIYLGGEMDQALQKKSVVDAKRCFIRFRSAARNRFYLADQNLKNGCQLLQQVGDPIEAVLEAA
jgi:TIR domain